MIKTLSKAGHIEPTFMFQSQKVTYNELHLTINRTVKIAKNDTKKIKLGMTLVQHLNRELTFGGVSLQPK